MGTGIIQGDSSTTELMQSHNFEWIKESELPFYRTNCDPFYIQPEWESLRKDSRIQSALEDIWKANQNAIARGYFETTPNRKYLFADDISLQAFFLSFAETFHAQKEALDSLGWMCMSDVTNFPDLLQWYGDGKKRRFHNNMLFNFYWFNQLMRTYENQGFQPHDKFPDFVRLWDSRNDIAFNIKRQRELYWNLYIQFYQADGYGTMVFSFDFDKGETHVRMKDFVMDGKHNFMWFSEFIEQNNPFDSLERLSFLYPMWYRGYTFPLINVTSITLMKDGKDIIYKHSGNGWKNWKISGNVQEQTAQILLPEVK